MTYSDGDQQGASPEVESPRNTGSSVTRGILGTFRSLRSLLLRWCLGSLLGTSFIAASSPWFVRSYAPLVIDPVRGTWVLPPDTDYRWTSEGYATSRIGPMGMPGRVSPITPPQSKQAKISLLSSGSLASSTGGNLSSRRSSPLRIALWGDSQAEGVCVADQNKLFAITERLSQGNVEVFPLARSGQDAADWLTQLPQVEEYLNIDLHLFLAVDLEDLLAANGAPVPPPSALDLSAANAAISRFLPAFVIQAARNLLTERDGSSRRSLRFRPGPVATETTSEVSSGLNGNTEEMTTVTPHHSTKPVDSFAGLLSMANSGHADQDRWNEAVLAIRKSTTKPIYILDAPVSPEIVDGRVRIRSLADADFVSMTRSASQHRVAVLSARQVFLDEAAEGRWPHGFQNGRIGSGHLNAHGNYLLAKLLLEGIATRESRPFADSVRSLRQWEPHPQRQKVSVSDQFQVQDLVGMHRVASSLFGQISPAED